MTQQFGLVHEARMRLGKSDGWNMAAAASSWMGDMALAMQGLPRVGRDKMHSVWMSMEDGWVVGGLEGMANQPDRFWSHHDTNRLTAGVPDQRFFAVAPSQIASAVERDIETAQLAMTSLRTYVNTNGVLDRQPGYGLHDDLNRWLETQYHDGIFKTLRLGGDPAQDEYGFEVYPSISRRGPGVRRVDNGWAPRAQAMRLLRPEMSGNPGASFHSALLDRKITPYTDFVVWTPEEMGRFQRDTGLFLAVHQAFCQTMMPVGRLLGGMGRLGAAAGMGATALDVTMAGSMGEMAAGMLDYDTAEFGTAMGEGSAADVANCADALICFVAGTRVLTDAGRQPIEQVKVGQRVWSRNDRIGEEGWKPVRHLFETHPESLVKLRYKMADDRAGAKAKVAARVRRGGREGGDRPAGGRVVRGRAAGQRGPGVGAAQTGSRGDSDGDADGDRGGDDGDGDDADGDSATLTGTQTHPFWSIDRQQWVPMAELRAGERLPLTQNAGEAVVQTLELEHAPSGDSFTTYNFEVADWHTYFVGEGEGVWVHNVGRRCRFNFTGTRRLATRGSLGTGGRVESAFAKLHANHIGRGTPPTDAARQFARQSGRATDDAGHVIGSLLGGRGGKHSANIIPQNLRLIAESS